MSGNAEQILARSSIKVAQFNKRAMDGYDQTADRPPNDDDMGNAIASAKIIGLILAINFINVTAPHTLKTPPSGCGVSINSIISQTGSEAASFCNSSEDPIPGGTDGIRRELPPV
jgi:hypothetical protein